MKLKEAKKLSTTQKLFNRKEMFGFGGGHSNVRKSTIQNKNGMIHV